MVICMKLVTEIMQSLSCSLLVFMGANKLPALAIQHYTQEISWC